MNEMIILVICHLIGDYVLQSDYIATTKGASWYHLFVHSALYSAPFMLVFGPSDPRIFGLFLTHLYIDAMKARYKKIGYVADQLLHYWVLVLLCIGG